MIWDRNLATSQPGSSALDCLPVLQGESMKGLVLSEYKQLDLVDMAKPKPGEDDLLICVQACGICGSDVHGYDGSTGRRLPPVVMGHGAAGIIEAVGGAVADFQPSQ